MNIQFKEAFIRASLLGGICTCLISPSYGMHNDLSTVEEEVKHHKLNKLKEEREEALEAEAEGKSYCLSKNYEKAYQCFLKAAEKNLPEAQYFLGRMFLFGQGINKDETKAREWFQKAANQDYTRQGYPVAEYYLAAICDEDVVNQKVFNILKIGKLKDLNEWFQDELTVQADSNVAVAIGVKETQYNLGARYTNGQEVEKDAVKAREYFLKAAKGGDANAEYNLGEMYRDGQGVAKDEQVAIEWFRKAADHGHREARYNLGVRYANGLGVPKDEKKAVELYTKAANQGLKEAQYNLGMMFLLGQGVEKDETKARECFLKAAKGGDANAEYNLGEMYRDGEGVAKDEQVATEWFRRAADHGHLRALYNLAVRYANGLGVPKDEKKAVELYTKAANQGSKEAQYNLGTMFLFGKGVPKNEKKAVELFTKAADQGLKEAQYILRKIVSNKNEGKETASSSQLNTISSLSKSGDTQSKERKEPSGVTEKSANNENGSGKSEKKAFYVIQHEGTNVPNALTVMSNNGPLDGYDLQEGQIIAKNYHGQPDDSCQFNIEEKDGKLVVTHQGKTLQYSDERGLFFALPDDSLPAWYLHESPDKSGYYYFECDNKKEWRANVNGAYDGHKWHWVTAKTGVGGPWWKHRLSKLCPSILREKC